MTHEKSDSGSGQDDDIATSSERFLELVRATVDFGDWSRTDDHLWAQIVRLVVFGRNEQASEMIQANSSVDATQAKEMVERIGIAADRVFYATGLRP